MKTTLLILSLFVGLVTYGQKDNVKVQKQGDLYEVTLFHENGLVSQTGFITADKKLHGTWKSFDNKGQKVSMGHYENGKKAGRWFFWKNNTEALTQVDFGSDYRIASVYEWKGNSQLADNESED
ncbi:antitoxin component YwqK of YwqJK toxin-antitoxin module [Wenyingzhuangia heitensis]|uniref:Antitoxin component YwqK of YwqJK toxin-antitoxin module n=1 Tax=Wenyingzhuangia heitensis TaxID=1487859 RepID=A0ABX0UC23_9FLAO|nr:nicotinic acid mononucleotide adenyltransferase [Wenyingzhuangia heitensis]NIJ44612.1 antitoxin component YwqK of YwqJK toxin-antitoxin module [Wenyingzhuangia heitensis]